MFSELQSHGSGERHRPYRTGWEVLLPSLGGLTLACFDPVGLVALDLAQIAAWVDVLVPDALSADRVLDTVRASGQSNVGVHVLDGHDVRPPSGHWDGLLMHDPAGVVADAAAVERMLGMFDRHGAADAFAYWCAPNALAVGGRSLSAGRRVTLSRMDRILGRHGLRGRAWPMVLAAGPRVSEVVPETGYAMLRNPGEWREKVKSLLWGSRLSRWLSHAGAVVAWRGGARPPLLERLARHVADQQLASPRWNQLLLLEGGKVVVGFEPCRGGPADGVVLIGTRDPLAVARREVEREDMRRLRESLPQALATLIPASYGRFEVDGLVCFLVERKRGVTIDSDVGDLAHVTELAADFLIAMSRASRRETVMDDALWDSRLERCLRQAIRRNPDVAERLRDLRRRVLDVTRGRPWVDVNMHGDYKIENVVYDPEARDLSGVIDWEHGQFEGSPYNDLAYLLAYNRQLRGQGWIEAARDLLAQRLSDDERALEARYWAAMALPPHLPPVLRALAPVHHIGFRRHGSWNVDELVQLRALLDEAIDSLGAA